MRYLVILLFCSLFTQLNFAQSSDNSDDFIKGFGETWTIDEAEFITDKDLVYKVIFDVHNSPDDPKELNAQINTIARFINMHVRAGVHPDQLKVAAVFHNKASHDILQSSFYHDKYKTDNPNETLIKALQEVNVELFFCGQSSRAREVTKDQIIPGVKVALSAMTVLIDYTARGYTIIKF
jgi:intracellular sulfur oxidation DsrE/DsrF family protein